MTPERHLRAGELFDKLVGLPTDRQQDYLDVACGSDADLRQYVAELLRAERETPETFLARPAIQEAVNLIAERAAFDPPVTGLQLGAYVVGKQIGAGGMGTVHEAHDVRLNRKVAIKILPPAFVGDPDRIRRFRQEARAASLLNHPNIVSIYDAELEQGRCYIATEFVEGQTLRQLAAAGPMDLKALIDIAIQICSALGAAHQAGIVHRDIKPENVMLRPDGIVKVLDFGLAKLLDTIRGENGLPLDASNSADASNRIATLHTRPGSIAGTLQYLSPEQVMGKPATPRSDIFSLGVMLYELATGVRPFAGPTEGAVFSNILNQTPAHASGLRPSITRDLDALIMRALEKDPELRFQTAIDLRSTLKLLSRESQSGTQIEPPAAVSAGVPVRRQSVRVLATAAAVVAMLGAGGVWVWLSSRPAPDPLPQRFTRLTEGPGEEIYPNLTPDGNQFFYASAAAGKWDIYLQRTGGNAAINLTADSPNDDTEPALSRDGSRICFRSERGGGGLFVMEATGENPTRIAARGHLPSWSPDGKSIVYSDQTFSAPSVRGPPTSGLHVIDVPSGRQRDLQTGDAMQPNWSPHGYRIAYWSLIRGNQRDIWTVGADGTGPVAVTDDAAVDWNPVWSPDGSRLYFISDRGGSMNLWRVRIDERTGHTRGAPEPVTTPASDIKYLSWSGDGKKFIYSQAQRRVNLFSIGFDKARQEVIGDPVPVGAVGINIANFSFSPDGSRIVYDTIGDPQEDIWISKLDGSGRRRVTSGGLNRAPQWSPNGDEILFFSNRSGFYNEFVIHADGSGLRQLTAVSSADRNMQAAIWIDGGKRILASNSKAGASIIDPHPTSPVVDPPILPGFGGINEHVLFMNSPVNGMFLGFFPDRTNEIFRYSVPAGKLERLGIEGEHPVGVPGAGSHRFVFIRGSVGYWYDLDLKLAKRLFSVAPNKIYSIRFDESGQRIYFTMTIREADLWMGQF